MTTLLHRDWLDLVWVATDHASRVAAFVTAGPGPIPAHVIRSGLDDIEKVLLELPKRSEARAEIEGRADTFVALAERGLFVYDWQDVYRVARDWIGKYERVATPCSPIRVDDLPSHVRAIAAQSTLQGVSFAEGQPINIGEFTDCLP